MPWVRKIYDSQNMIIVTGGAGFIGANIVKALNDEGRRDILVVDNLEQADKFKNLVDCEIANFMDKREFRQRLLANTIAEDIQIVFHEGACSDTMATDGRYVMDNNYTYSRELLSFCVRQNAQFIYASSASVYGDNQHFAETVKNEKPLNVYAYSKWLFDQHVRTLLPQPKIQIVGLRYFNVYGSREQHKGRMASVAYHFYHQYLQNGFVNLFEGTDGYANGEQRRDFVFADDVAAVNLHFAVNPDVCGVYNVGTGKCASFNNVGLAVVNTLRGSQQKKPLTLLQAIKAEELRYVPLPAALNGKYQSFTEADLKGLRASGYDREFHDVEQGVRKYLNRLAST